MITKISTIIPSKHNYNNRKHISFKSYNTASNNVDISYKDVLSPIHSKSGNIDIYRSKISGNISNMSGNMHIDHSRISGNLSDMSGNLHFNHSKINGNVSNKSGGIYATSSNIEGNIKNVSGKIEVNEYSDIHGNISSTNGSIILERTILTGNVTNKFGETLVMDSNVYGTITSTPDKLHLRGKNRIKELVLSGYKKTDAKQSADNIIAKPASRGIFISKNNSHMIITGANNVTIHSNGAVIDNMSQHEASEKPLIFRLPKGNIIDTIRFDADKQGILIIEDGAEFSGKVINGTIERASTYGMAQKSTKNTAEAIKREKSDKTSCETKSDAKPLESVLSNNPPEKEKITEELIEKEQPNYTPNILKLQEQESVKERITPLLFAKNDIPVGSDATDLPSKRFHHSSTFRDEELFDENMDLLRNQKYLQYSKDDVPLRDDLWMEDSKLLAQYNQQFTKFYPETSYRDEMMFYSAIHSPWRNPKEDETKAQEDEIFMNKAREKINKISDDRSLPNKIFESCTILRKGKNEIDSNLCNLALGLFKNSEKWGEVEEQIIKEVKIPIFGKTYGAISYLKYKMAKVDLLYDYPNKIILERLKKVSPLDVYRLRGI